MNTSVMLTQLTVSNFATVKFLELDFAPGMTSITGETGAGKSIAIDALSLCLGSRGDASVVRSGASKTELSARFDLAKIPAAHRWLIDNALDDEDDCIVRRAITSEGRSRAWINGTPVPMTQLKTLGEFLVSIHGQHAHLSLLRQDNQLALLDQYAGHQQLLDACRQTYRDSHAIEAELTELTNDKAQRTARAQLLEYQVEELNEFGLQPGEFESIESEHRRLANSESLMAQSHLALQLLSESDEVSVQSLLQQAIKEVESLSESDTSLSPTVNMLHEGLIQIQESANELSSYHDNLEADPERFEQLESRLSKALELARKHQVNATELAEHHQSLLAELTTLTQCDDRINELNQQLEQSRQALINDAKRLNKSRCRYAKELNKLVTNNLKELALPHAQFEITIEHQQESISALGADKIQYQITTNPGQPLQPLAKAASGGELSRIGLAIQTITAQKVATPTLIFDEVDVGISGPTAAVVGRMLRQLGQSTQVFCVTHLPQVAGNGHNHLLASKSDQGKVAETQLTTLSKQQRVSELARLLGGDTITENTLANASELLVKNDSPN